MFFWEGIHVAPGNLNPFAIGALMVELYWLLQVLTVACKYITCNWVVRKNVYSKQGEEFEKHL